MHVMRQSVGIVHPDEKANLLVEIDLLSPPPGQEMHRYQIILVVRDDQIKPWVKDLGLSSGFTSGQFQFLSMFEDSVAQLQDMATARRLDSKWTADVLAEHRENSTLIIDSLEAIEEREKIERNASVFGSEIQRQRNS